ncbi:hypothetical protein ERN12_10445 [Rhodobacteraceae bacterium]|nr:hypothetical protein ERN12_10445 [Paracoccaceae bacterium]
MPAEQTDPLRHTALDASASPAGIGRAERVALAMTIVWLGIAGALWFSGTTPPDATEEVQSVQMGLMQLMALVAVFLPIALIWVATFTMRQIRALRAEAVQLRRALDGGGASADLLQGPPQGPGAPSGAASYPPRAAAPADGPTQTPPASAPYPGAVRRAGAPAQPAVAPEDSAQTEPLSLSVFIQAVNFPDDANDREGFQALRQALRDPTVAKLIRSAQDVLNLLSQDGLYMDDLTPQPAPPAVWRRYATGERGADLAELGGIQEEAALELAQQRMEDDTIFRDAIHHFLRQFDRTFAGFEKSANDQDLEDLAQTRTARAFMLLGQVAGNFG